MTLTCGGRGPCCHVGYPHRHCEHCDVVIPTQVQPHTHGWTNHPFYYGTLQSSLQQTPRQALQSGLTDYLSNGEQAR